MRVGDLFIWDNHVSSRDAFNIVIGDDRDDSHTHLIYLNKKGQAYPGAKNGFDGQTSLVIRLDENG